MGLGQMSRWVSSCLMLLEGNSGRLSQPVRFHTHGSNLQESGTFSDDINISMLLIGDKGGSPTSNLLLSLPGI